MSTEVIADHSLHLALLLLEYKENACIFTDFFDEQSVDEAK